MTGIKDEDIDSLRRLYANIIGWVKHGCVMWYEGMQ